jgi:cytochrome b
MSEQATLQVWDRFVRTFHWLLLVAFIVAMVSEGEPMIVHVWAGYLIGVLIMTRLIWGFVGPKYARFSNFIYSPRTVVSYLRGVVSARAPRYVGHNPAGGAMIVLLLISLSLTVFTGMATLAEEENSGPLAPVFGTTAAAPGGLLVSSAFADDDHDHDHKHGDSAFEDIHEFFANFTVFLALFHVAGVLLSSLAHRENLMWSMVNGRKKAKSKSV